MNSEDKKEKKKKTPRDNCCDVCPVLGHSVPSGIQLHLMDPLLLLRLSHCVSTSAISQTLVSSFHHPMAAIPQFGIRFSGLAKKNRLIKPHLHCPASLSLVYVCLVLLRCVCVYMSVSPSDCGCNCGRIVSIWLQLLW